MKLPYSGNLIVVTGRDLHEKTGSSLDEGRLVFMTLNHADFKEDETGTFTLHFSESVISLC